MSRQLGRISGALLKDNLLRNGIDLAFENDLLYLDIINSKIGIKTSSPVRQLEIVTGVKTTNQIADQAKIDDIDINNDGSISTVLGDLNITAANNVSATRIGVGNIEIDQNKIYTTITNQNLNLQLFDATKKVKTYGDTEVIGNLHTTGDITLDGNIIFGTDSGDSVIFASDIDSNIIPDQNDVYSMGESNSRRWNNTYAGLLNGLLITVDSIIPGSGIFPETRQGNTWYVAANGNDNNVGNHQNGPFASVEKALSVSAYGDSIIIYPGIYDELLPLTIPAGVTVKGIDIRNTIIKPDTASTNKDVFLLNGEVTISDLTIKDFYYDSINNTGYAFRFAPGFKVTNRSPYIQNVSVITTGSITSGNDPRGFDAGDAGRGALFDGSVADINTNQAGCLLTSVTFITPGVDAITMTNGVRVESVGCFTYFANRAFYAIRGTGRILQDGSTKQYGAELRVIGSSNIYGNYGAMADGIDTIMYLVNHNFSYIGSGKDATNDRLLTIRDNEDVELNGGQIYYDTTNYGGTFRVGHTFYVDMAKGTTSIDTSGLTAGSIVGLNITDNSNATFIDATVVNTGNISIHNNTVESLVGEVDIASASNKINLQDNTFMQQSLSMTGNFSIGGDLTLGNDSGDTIIILPAIEENVEPKTNNVYNLGSLAKNWKDILVRTAQISDINIDTNVIRTTVSNADLELRANGTGGILFEQTKINEKTITTTSGKLIINPATTLDIFANTNITANLAVTGNINTNGNIIVGDQNTDFVVVAAEINSDVVPSINDAFNLGSISRKWKTILSDSLEIDDIEINTNYIRTTVSNSDLEFFGNGTGGVLTQSLRFRNNTLEAAGTNQNIEITLNGSSVVNVNTNTSMLLPKGPTVTMSAGGIRFNTTESRFTGQATARTAFAGVYSDNRLTRAYATPTSNEIIFLIDPIQAMNVDSTRTYVQGLTVDSITVNNNIISTNNTNLNLTPDGTAIVDVFNLRFNDNIIENTSVSGLTTINHTGTGYLKFNGTRGIVIPAGGDADRPILPQEGTMRWSTDQIYLEIYVNGAWGLATSTTGGFASPQQIQEFGDIWSLILG